ncbi:MAG: hypothetical protein EBS07_04250 [Sphingobacteriia bacterium]|jgi:hypothetical protein|nr:hypothetical protein [Sphingobacteriia bacterium]
MTFEEFILKKKINIQLFQERLPEEWNQIQNAFTEMGPKSFDHYYKFRFNEWRHVFPLNKGEGNS